VQSFRFRLQRVLDWQQKVSQAEEEKLHQRLAEVAHCQEKLAKLAARSVAMEHEFLGRSWMVPPDLKAFAEFRRSTVKERLELARELEKKEKLLADQRQKLLTERRKLQVYEKLRERALKGYTLEADRELEALGLESYLSAFIKRRSASQPD
jgi:flagellar export protein FliJ